MQYCRCLPNIACHDTCTCKTNGDCRSKILFTIVGNASSSSSGARFVVCATFLDLLLKSMKALTLLERLSKEPYSLNIQLDDLSAEESLQQVCDAVLSTITNKSSPNGQLTKDDSITLLSALGFKEMNTAEKQESFRRGERPIVLSALQYIAEQPAELLQKRCYLAKFLLPVVIPKELQPSSCDNANTDALLKHYQQLQTQFKSVHRQYSALQKEVAPFAQLGEEIEQLETERTHLAHRIDDLQNQAKNRSDPELFEKILNATSAMRLLQEEEIRQQQQLKETAKLFEVVNRNYSDADEHLALLERCILSSSGEKLPTVDSILEYLARSAKEYSTNVRSDLTLSHHRAKERLNELSSDSHFTNDNLLALRLQVDKLQEDCKLKEVAIGRRRAGNNGGGTSGVDIFITYNNEAATTLAAKKVTLETKRKELLGAEAMLKELEIEVGESRSTVTKTDSLILPIDQPSAAVKDRRHDDDTGVTDEASSRELEQRRAELLDLEDEHKTKRERYERLSLRFAADRQSLEDEVARLEKDWMSIDSNQKELQESKEKTEGALKRLDDFDTVAAEYQKEIAHQEEKLHQLHEKKRSIDEQYSYGSKQRDLFAKVERLLRIQQQDLGLVPRVVG